MRTELVLGLANKRLFSMEDRRLKMFVYKPLRLCIKLAKLAEDLFT